MRTTIDIDKQLMEKALRLSQAQTKKEIVHLALEAYVRRLQRLRFLQHFGKVEWTGNLDEMRAL